MSRISKNQELILLLIILVIGSFLRFYKCYELNYTHDELSGLYRIHYNTIGDIIKYGIMSEGHPAGSHFFMLAWSKLFGESEFAMKLPFILLGIASIYLIYKLAKAWYSSSTAILSAALFAVLQTYILYSQMARPYGLGIFFVLLAAWGWTLYFFSDKKESAHWKSLIIYIIGVSGASYSHQFSAFSVFLLGLSGLFFCTTSNWKKYIIANFLVVLLYIPHIPITIKQLGLGGIGGPDGWLDPPTNDFLFSFLAYTLHFSWILGATVIMVFIYSLVAGKREIGGKKFRLLSIGWFCIVLGVSWWYSLAVNPLLQFSTLVFSMPFIIILLFSCIPPQSFKILLVIIGLFSATGIYSLVKERKHYEMMLNQPYEYYAKNSTEILETVKPSSYLAFNTESPYLVQPLLDKYKNKIIYTVPENFKDIRTRIDKQNPDILFLQNIQPAFLEVLRYEFPYTIKQYNGFGFEYYAISKHKKDSVDNGYTTFYSKFPEVAHGKWNVDAELSSIDSSSGKSRIDIRPDKEFGLGFEINAGALLKGENSQIAAVVGFTADSSFTSAKLVISIENKDKSIVYQNTELSSFFTTPGQYQKAALVAQLNNVKGITPECIVKIYLWNPEKQHFIINDFEIKVYPGNEKRFGIISPL